MADAKPKKQKKPTALKRKLQSDKKNLLNRAFKSKVKTSLKKLKTFHESGEKENLALEVNAVTSLMDKGVKKGIYKKAKASRVKSSAAKLLNA
ncbi:MAG: 30S ribosomal protein S20 [Rhabdochlamydiaceae bacterium]|nr:30S ribosomal protein S20 [Candidatus Amphrikana amoebophyrae]